MGKPSETIKRALSVWIPVVAVWLNAELYTAFDVMASPVVTVYPKQSVYKVAKILLTTTHSGFPVAKKQTMLSKSKHFYGLITRKELYILLMKEEVFCTKEEIENESEKVLNKSLEHDHWYRGLPVSTPLAPLSFTTWSFTGYPFINDSAISIPTKFSLYRAFLIFRTMGLRHLVVVDEFNCIRGIITRKDLMDFKMLENISKVVFSKKKEGKVSATRVTDDSWDINAMWDTSILDSEIADMKDVA
ncbi:Hypothetical predicted protein [Octopus vulgaris]|uniref:CBS domain-containing protein n=1 Tax=Octopus vulgaris TaxID=6645 RepID=A0AA36AHW5_OCTVU|nr:Hypothetical predicted protein [Octopus vulgaris]